MTNKSGTGSAIQLPAFNRQTGESMMETKGRQRFSLEEFHHKHSKGARSDRLRLKHAVDTRLPCISPLLFFYPHSRFFFYPLPLLTAPAPIPPLLLSELLFLLLSVPLLMLPSFITTVARHSPRTVCLLCKEPILACRVPLCESGWAFLRSVKSASV